MRSEEELREAYEACCKVCNAIARGEISAEPGMAEFYWKVRDCLQWTLGGDPQPEGCNHSFDQVMKQAKRVSGEIDKLRRWNRG